MRPDTLSAVELREKVAIAAAHPVSQLSFYHYGKAPLEALDWIGAALAGVPGHDREPGVR